jgi:hypothetical protein
MSAKIGLFIIVLTVFLTCPPKVAAQPEATAHIRATATVVMPVGFYNNLSEWPANGPDSPVIEICHPRYAGIIVTISNDTGMLEKYQFSDYSENGYPEKTNASNRASMALERAVLSFDDRFFRDYCLVTIIYSEN